MREVHTERHKGGTIMARGPMVDGQPDGYWEWFRTDGSRLRSRYSAAGQQTGEWTTYDGNGVPYKVTTPGGKPTVA